MKIVPVIMIHLLTVFTSLDCCFGKARRTSFTRYSVNRQQNTKLQLGNDVLLLCETDGRPSTIQIREFRQQKTLNASSNGEQSLTHLITDLTCEKRGVYECVIDNETSHMVGVMPPDCPPLSCENNANNMTLFVDVNEPVNITLCVLIYRDIANYINISNKTVKKQSESLGWTWNYQDNNLATQFVRNLTIVVTRINMSIEYGEIRIQVLSNSEQTTGLDFNIELRSPGPPECPTELIIADRGLEYILSWKPGSNGGKKQSFHVFFSKDMMTWHIHNLTYHDHTTTTITGLLENTIYYFRVVPSNKLRATAIFSFCDNTITGRTNLRAKTPVLVSTFLPPVVVVICAVILTIALSIRKEKRLRNAKLAQDSRMCAVTAGSGSI